MASYFFARKKKRQPVVADPKLWSVSSTDDDKPFHAEPKSESEKQQLVAALKDHYVFSALSTNDILQVIHRMRKREFKSGADICTEGTTGDEFFVLAAGECDIIVKGEKVGAYKPGQSFGELALLYSCTRAATIKATSSCTCWAVDAATFRKVAIRSKQGAARGRLDFLKKVPLLQGLDSGTLQRVADALKRVEFAAGSKIVTEGEPGDDFYLIEDGEVKCTKKAGSEEQHLMTLKRGDYFGEMVRVTPSPRRRHLTYHRPLCWMSPATRP
jgi:cAMP-dependent protein kinase regulator